MDTLTDLLLLWGFLLSLYLGLALLETLLDWLERWGAWARPAILAWSELWAQSGPHQESDPRVAVTATQRHPPPLSGSNRQSQRLPGKPSAVASLQESLPLAIPAPPRDSRLGFDNGLRHP